MNKSTMQLKLFVSKSTIQSHQSSLSAISLIYALNVSQFIIQFMHIIITQN